MASIVLAELIGVKIFSLENSLGIKPFSFSFFGEHNLSLNLSVGVLPWPIIFILTDVINDYFGLKTVRFISIIAVVFVSVAFLILYIAIHTTPESSWWIGSNTQNGVPNMQNAYQSIFGQGMNIILASILAFFIGQMIDAFIFQNIKKITKDKYVGLRATVSTLVSQLMDSVVVTVVAFYFLSNMSLGMALALAFTAYMYKFCMALLSTPILYAVHYIIEKYLGKEQAKLMREEAMLT